MDNATTIDTLNDLIETSRDGEQGFRSCAAAVQSQHLRQLFEHAAERCRTAIGQLEREVRQLGGQPQSTGSASGAAHRGWLNLKTAIAGRDDAAILDECERGEDVAKRAYQKALDAGLPENLRRIVETQFRGVRENHDKVRDLRNEARQRAGGSGGMTRQMGEGMGRVAEAGIEYARTVRETAASSTGGLTEQPMMTALIGFAVGYGIAWMLHAQRR